MATISLPSRTQEMGELMLTPRHPSGTDRPPDETKRFGAILVDPPWNFRTNGRLAPVGPRSVLWHYPVMKLDDLKTIPVADYAARNCALFLWCPDAHLAQGMDLIRAWQFKYTTVGFNWIKTTSHGKLPLGCGWWTRAGSELCLLATRGQPRPLAYDVRRVVLSERREHSRKPDEIHDFIERLVKGPYLELFARERRPGWSYALSPEINKFDPKRRHDEAARFGRRIRAGQDLAVIR